MSVTVVPEYAAYPSITLLGSSTIELYVGDTWTDPGAIAEDYIDGDLTNSIGVNGIVDTTTGGTYTLIYTVNDSGSYSTSTTRTVVVIDESVTYSNSSFTPTINGFTLYTDFNLQGEDATSIVSKGVFLGDVKTNDQDLTQQSISIDLMNVNYEEYEIKFFVETENKIYYSEVQSLSPLSSNYLFSNITFEEIVGFGGTFSYDYSKQTPEANLDISEKGVLIAKSENDLINNKYSGSGGINSFSLELRTVKDGEQVLEGNTTYFMQAYITNEYGTSTSDVVSFQTKYMMKDRAQGGIVVYVESNGEHGLVMAELDHLSELMVWSTEYNLVGVKYEGSSTDTGYFGQDFSNTLYQYYKNNSGSSPVANYCEEIDINSFSDWFLGDINANARAKQWGGVPTSVDLWTSLEASYNSDTDAMQYHNYNNMSPRNKKDSLKVIPFRRF